MNDQIFDDGRCLVCVEPGRAGAELQYQLWHGQRVGLCPTHAQYVQRTALEKSISEVQALDEMLDRLRAFLMPGSKGETS